MRNKRISKEKGITLIALVVTIIVLLILAGVTINLVLSNGGLMERARDSSEVSEKAQIIDIAKMDIMEKQVDNHGELSEEELIEILTSPEYSTQGTLSDNGEESVLEKILTTKGGKYEIKVSDIYDGTFSGGTISLEALRTKISKESGDCMIDMNGNIFTTDKWRYEITGEDTCKIYGYDDPYSDFSAYKSREIEGGTFKYGIPAFIKENNRIYTMNNIDSGGWQSSYITNQITNLIIPDTVINLGSGAFSSISSLQQIVIPNSVKYIASNAFSNCSSLNSVSISDNVEYVGGYAFDYTPFFNSLSDGLIYFGNALCCYKGTMSSNTSITLRENTISIGDHAFGGYTDLVSINIPNSIKMIGDFAFGSCSNLQSITIPNSVKRMGYCIFNAWTSSQTININYKQSELPEEWVNNYWNYNCNAQINYLPE